VLVFCFATEPRPLIGLLMTKLLVELIVSKLLALTSITLPDPSALVVPLRIWMKPPLLVQLPAKAELLPDRNTPLVTIFIATVILALPLMGDCNQMSRLLGEL